MVRDTRFSLKCYLCRETNGFFLHYYSELLLEPADEDIILPHKITTGDLIALKESLDAV